MNTYNLKNLISPTLNMKWKEFERKRRICLQKKKSCKRKKKKKPIVHMSMLLLMVLTQFNLDLIEKINGFVIEPPTLFKGRGAHPKAGVLKPRIQP